MVEKVYVTYNQVVNPANTSTPPIHITPNSKNIYKANTPPPRSTNCVKPPPPKSSPPSNPTS